MICGFDRNALNTYFCTSLLALMNFGVLSQELV